MPEVRPQLPEDAEREAGRRLRRTMWLFPMTASLLWAALLELEARQELPDPRGRVLLAGLAGTISMIGFGHWIMAARAPETTLFWRVRWLVVQSAASGWILCTCISPVPLSSLRPTADDFMRAVENNQTWRARVFLAIGFADSETASGKLPAAQRLSQFEHFHARALAKAAANGDLPLVSAIWERGSAAHTAWQVAAGYDRSLPWFVEDAVQNAAAAGHWEVLAFLRSHGMSRYGDAISAAAGAGRIDILRRLLDEGDDPNLGLTAAARNGRLDVVRLLLDAGGDPRGFIWPPDKVARIGNSPLMVAIERNQVAVVEELIRRGVDVNFWGTYQIDEKCCLPMPIETHPLSYARQRGRTRIVELLVAAGADESARSERPAPTGDSDPP